VLLLPSHRGRHQRCPLHSLHQLHLCKMALPRSWTVVILLVLQAILIFMVFRGTTGFMKGMTMLQGDGSDGTGTATATATAKMTFDAYFRELYQYHVRQVPTGEQVAAQNEECGPFPFTRYFAQGQSRRSRLWEDKVVFETFFQDVPMEELKTYKYMEIGGFNGMDESNSRFFETCLQWEGLLVEPNPHPFGLLLANRPHAHRASYAVSCSVDDALANQTVPFHDYIFANAAQADTNSAYKGGRTIDVPCGPIHPVVRDVLGPHVHFFSLDVEGAEPMVLRAMDFGAIFVDVLIVEVHNNFCLPNQPCVTRNQSREIMHANGYHRFEGFIKASDVHVHPQSQFLAKILAMRQPTQLGR
jgi:FkbM family methyltransferase